MYEAEYYDSIEQHFWEGPCNDPSCEYCRRREADVQAFANLPSEKPL